MNNAPTNHAYLAGYLQSSLKQVALILANAKVIDYYSAKFDKIEELMLEELEKAHAAERRFAIEISGLEDEDFFSEDGSRAYAH